MFSWLVGWWHICFLKFSGPILHHCPCPSACYRDQSQSCFESAASLVDGQSISQLHSYFFVFFKQISHHHPCPTAWYKFCHVSGLVRVRESPYISSRKIKWWLHQYPLSFAHFSTQECIVVDSLPHYLVFHLDNAIENYLPCHFMLCLWLRAEN